MKIYMWLCGCNTIIPKLSDVFDEKEYKKFCKKLGSSPLKDSSLDLQCKRVEKLSLKFSKWEKFYGEEASIYKDYRCCPFDMYFIWVENGEITTKDMREAILATM